MTDSNTSVIKKYLKPSEEAFDMTRREILDLFDAESIPPSIMRRFAHGSILCTLPSNPRKIAYTHNTTQNLDWLARNGYVEVFPKPAEILT